MGNLIAVLTHCGRGDGAIVGDRSHTFLNEGGGASVWGGIYMLPLPNQADGTLEPAAIETAIPAPDDHHPRVNLICLENTHNYCGGVALSAEYTQTIAEVARRNHLALHLDGARIFNAALALGVDPRELAAPADSVMFCLSKGLSCPVGSMLCGSAEFITRARRVRKMLGGGMRQAGVLAAAGVVALEQMVERMQEDHDNARLLAEGIAQIPGLSLNLDTVQTNIVFFDCVSEHKTAEQFVDGLREQGILMMVLGGGRVRAVTHYGIDRGDIERSLQAMRQVMTA
jgi:threonine aldolase